jgi:hypothetical protein
MEGRTLNNEMQKIIKESKGTDISSLIAAKEAAKQRMLEDSSSANISAFERASAFLNKALESEPEEQPETAKDVPGDRWLPNLLECSAWLKELGYKVGKSKLYNDRDKGLLYVWPDKRVYKSDAELYARKHLPLGKSVDVADPATRDLEQLQREKLQGEVARLKAQIDKMEFEMSKDQGKYMLKGDLYREMASRWMVMDQAMTHFFRSAAPDLVACVDGDKAKVPDLLDKLLSMLRRELNEFANTEKFHVIIVDDEEDAAVNA